MTCRICEDADDTTICDRCERVACEGCMDGDQCVECAMEDER